MKWEKNSGDAFGYLEECEIFELNEETYMVIGREGEMTPYAWEIAKIQGIEPLKYGHAPTVAEAKSAAETAAQSLGFKTK